MTQTREEFEHQAHSPLPWVETRTTSTGDSDAVCGVACCANTFVVCDCLASCDRDVVRNPDLARANAAFIARACNAHDELLAACRELRAALAGAMRVIARDAASDDLTERFVEEMAAIGILNGVGVRADAAIAKAEGGR